MAELHINAVTFRYPSTESDVFASLSLTLHSGTVSWIRGRNGAGKTTLFHVIAGLRRPQKGTVTLNGHPITRDRVVYVPSEPAVFEELDAFEHATLVEELWQLRGAERERYRSRFVALATELRVPRDQRRVSEFSAGMREKLALSLLLALDADVVLLDEPFTASDADGLASGQRILAEIAKNAIVAVTSHLPAVVSPLDPVVVELDDMSEGKESR